jgi:aminopeptidase YwaD
MQQEKFSGKSAYEFCRYLTNEIGERVQGLETTPITMEYIKNSFKEFGLQNIDVDTFPVVTSQQKLAQIQIGKRKFNALSFGLSGNTPPEGIREQIIKLQPWSWKLTADQRKQVENRIVLLYSRNISQQVFHELIGAGVRGIIYITYHPNIPPKLPMGFVYAGLTHQKNIQLPPIVSVSFQDGHWIWSQANELTMFSDVEIIKSESYNVIGEIAGNHSEEVLLLSAHYDSVPYSVGAADNAGGTAILMELARILADFESRYTIRFIASGSEECAMQGAEYYCGLHNEELQQTVLSMNFDVHGAKLGNLALGVIGAKRLQKPLNNYLEQWTPEIIFAPTGGDNRIFALHNVPTIHWWFGGGVNFLLNHTSQDTINNISPSSLELVGKAAKHLITALSNFKTLSFPIPADQLAKNREGLTYRIKPKVKISSKCA